MHALTATLWCVTLPLLQDIAVDGWALTLLPPHHIEYASTCQTLGMNTGYFTSFTIFLALSNAEFCNKYIRSNSLLAGVHWRRGVGVRAAVTGPLCWGYATAKHWWFPLVDRLSVA